MPSSNCRSCHIVQCSGSALIPAVGLGLPRLCPPAVVPSPLQQHTPAAQIKQEWHSNANSACWVGRWQVGTGPVSEAPQGFSKQVRRNASFRCLSLSFRLLKHGRFSRQAVLQDLQTGARTATADALTCPSFTRSSPRTLVGVSVSMGRSTVGRCQRTHEQVSAGARAGCANAAPEAGAPPPGTPNSMPAKVALYELVQKADLEFRVSAGLRDRGVRRRPGALPGGQRSSQPDVARTVTNTDTNTGPVPSVGVSAGDSDAGVGLVWVVMSRNPRSICGIISRHSPRSSAHQSQDLCAPLRLD